MAKGAIAATQTASELVAADEFRAEVIRLEQEAKLEKKLKKLDRLKMGAAEYNQQQKRTIKEHRASAESSLPLSARIGERLMSRIYEMCDIVPFDGVQDFRINVLGGANLKRIRK